MTCNKSNFEQYIFAYQAWKLRKDIFSAGPKTMNAQLQNKNSPSKINHSLKMDSFGMLIIYSNTNIRGLDFSNWIQSSKDKF